MLPSLPSSQVRPSFSYPLLKTTEHVPTGSPMVFILLIYVVLGTGMGYEHRISHIVGGIRGSKKVHWRANAVVIGSILWWITFMVFVLRNESKDFFSQTACDDDLVYNKVSVFVLILPYGAVLLYIWKAIQWKSLDVIVTLLPLVPVLLSIVFIMLWRRKMIRLLGGGKYLLWNAW